MTIVGPHIADHARRQPRTRTGSRGRSMPQQTAVVVLAAGAGTRMRSKTPKVLHSLAGRRCSRTRCTRRTRLDPAHLVTVGSRPRPSRRGGAESREELDLRSRRPFRRSRSAPARGAAAWRAAGRFHRRPSWSPPRTCPCWTATPSPSARRAPAATPTLRGHRADLRARRPDGYGRIGASANGQLVEIVGACRCLRPGLFAYRGRLRRDHVRRGLRTKRRGPGGPEWEGVALSRRGATCACSAICAEVNHPSAMDRSNTWRVGWRWR